MVSPFYVYPAEPGHSLTNDEFPFSLGYFVAPPEGLLIADLCDSLSL